MCISGFRPVSLAAHDSLVYQMPGVTGTTCRPLPMPVVADGVSHFTECGFGEAVIPVATVRLGAVEGHIAIPVVLARLIKILARSDKTEIPAGGLRKCRAV